MTMREFIGQGNSFLFAPEITMGQLFFLKFTILSPRITCTHRKDLKMNILVTGRKPLCTDFQEYRVWSFSKAPVLISSTIINKTWDNNVTGAYLYQANILNRHSALAEGTFFPIILQNKKELSSLSSPSSDGSYSSPADIVILNAPSVTFVNK